MRVLLALTYYRPHISGLTIHIQRIAEGLAARGHEVTVLTSRYKRHLPREDTQNGVRVVRVPVWYRLGKGVLAPGWPAVMARELRRHDILLLSVPANPDTVWWARRLAARLSRPMVVVFACDVHVEEGWTGGLLERWCRVVFAQACRHAERIVVLSDDYARHTRALDEVRSRTVALAPPIAAPAPGATAIQRLRERYGLRSADAHLVFAARIAREKGVEFLLDAIEQLESAGATNGRRLRLIITGDQPEVIGERRYWRALQDRIRRHRERLILTGELTADEMSACFAAADVTVLPSVNATESFGMVQVESMLCGTPVVASDLPGVREPVTRTGMGRLAAPGDSRALAAALAEVLADRPRFVRSRAAIAAVYDYDRSLTAHEALLMETLAAQATGEQTRNQTLAEFERQSRTIPAFRALVRSVESVLVRAAGPLARPTLDVGCGDAHFAASVSHVFDAGIDLDRTSLAEARGAGAHHIVLQSAAGALPFADGTFGTVVANSTLEHVAGLDAALAEIARVLRPGGRVILTAPSDHFGAMLGAAQLARRLGFAALGRRYAAWFNRHSQHYVTDSPERWTARLESHDLRVLSARYYLSARAHAWFDLLHYLSVPNLIARRMTGVWVPSWLRAVNASWVRLARRAITDTGTGAPGPYVMLIAERRR